MVDPEIVREWKAKGDEDFAFALVNLQEDKPFYAQICFHFHQAAEKYLKTYVVAHEMEFRKVHDLLLLLQICATRDPSAAELREPCEFLNVFYVETRYPVHWPTQFTRMEAERACEAADRVKHWIELQIPIHPEP